MASGRDRESALVTRYSKSREWLERARRVIPGGAQTLSKMAERFPEGAYPAILHDAHGPRVWDVDGNEYLDWICGLGAITLGYCDERVDNRVGCLAYGAPSLPTELEVIVAEKLYDLIPCAEMVRFVKTGSEATEGAIRIARAATGKKVVLTCGYHSWHSWYAATKKNHPGVPNEMAKLAREFRYNDLDDFSEALCWDNPAGEDVAAVIIEPTLIEPPHPDFLEAVAELTGSAGAVLIFDETVTGFRWNAGGYQAVCGVTPDLATFGKGMGNGYPVACIVGRRELMEEHGKLVSGTFNGDTVGLAAASAVIDVYTHQDVCGTMREYGEMLFRAFPDLLIGQPYHPKWKFTGAQMAVFLQETARRGVLYHPGGFNVCAGMTVEDVEKTIDATTDALKAMSAGAKLEGKMPQDNPFRVTQ